MEPVHRLLKVVPTMLQFLRHIRLRVVSLKCMLKETSRFWTVRLLDIGMSTNSMVSCQ